MSKYKNKIIIVLMVIIVILMGQLQSLVGIVAASVALGYFLAMNAADEWLEDDDEDQTKGG